MIVVRLSSRLAALISHNYPKNVTWFIESPEDYSMIAIAMKTSGITHKHVCAVSQLHK
jgi:hypothetical protein